MTSTTDLNAAKDEQGLITLATDKAVLAGEQTSQVIALVLTMPTDVGNEVNYTGSVAPQINLGLHVLATQHMEEKDGFSNDYDKDATYPGIENSDAPKAEVTPLNPGDENYPDETTKPITYLIGEGPDYLDAAYKFSATETKAEAEAGKYANWIADFVVYADKVIPAGSIALAGQYGTYPWFGFVNEDFPVAANQQFRLLKDATDGQISVNYTEVCTFKDFYCGAVAVNEEALSGTTLTVELRLYETKDPADTENNTQNEETGKYVIIGTFPYTFE